MVDAFEEGTGTGREEDGAALSVAYFTAEGPQLAVVHCFRPPIGTSETFVWSRGETSPRSLAGDRARPRHAPDGKLDGGSVALVSNDQAAQPDHMVTGVGGPAMRVVASLAHRLAMLAMGEADATLELGAVAVPSIAAGLVMLEATGGAVADASGARIEVLDMAARGVAEVRGCVAGDVALLPWLASRPHEVLRSDPIEPFPSKLVLPTRRRMDFGPANRRDRARGALLGFHAAFRWLRDDPMAHPGLESMLTADFCATIARTDEWVPKAIRDPLDLNLIPADEILPLALPLGLIGVERGPAWIRAMADETFAGSPSLQGARTAVCTLALAIAEVVTTGGLEPLWYNRGADWAPEPPEPHPDADEDELAAETRASALAASALSFAGGLENDAPFIDVLSDAQARGMAPKSIMLLGALLGARAGTRVVPRRWRRGVLGTQSGGEISGGADSLAVAERLLAIGRKPLGAPAGGTDAVLAALGGQYRPWFRAPRVVRWPWWRRGLGDRMPIESS